MHCPCLLVWEKRPPCQEGGCWPSPLAISHFVLPVMLAGLVLHVSRYLKQNWYRFRVALHFVAPNLKSRRFLASLPHLLASPPLCSYENKPAEVIQKDLGTDYLSRINAALTVVRGVNKTDVKTLGDRCVGGAACDSADSACMPFLHAVDLGIVPNQPC